MVDKGRNNRRIKIHWPLDGIVVGIAVVGGENAIQRHLGCVSSLVGGSIYKSTLSK